LERKGKGREAIDRDEARKKQEPNDKGLLYRWHRVGDGESLKAFETESLAQTC
jgi:hypothetical protein